MWYQQTLEVVRLRHALRTLLGEERPFDPEEALAILEAFGRIAADDAHPAFTDDLPQEYERWRSRAMAFAANAREN